MSFCHDRSDGLFRTPCVVNRAAIRFLDANPFLDEMFSLTMLAFGILFFDGRDMDDAANVMVALGVGGQDA